jgi:hypothetical protein
MTARRACVVVWSTGGIGSIVISAIQRRSEIELVGVWVHAAAKVGKDAGELANGQPVGLKTNGNADAPIALRPDCVIYAASGPERDAPQGIGDLSYRVVVTGDPDIDCTLAVTLKDPAKAGIGGMTSGAGAMVATAMRVLNAVPYVVAAEPGLVSSLDLPLTVPKNGMVSA